MIFLFALIGVVVVATVLTELEYFGWATALLLAIVVGGQLFSVLPVLSWIGAHTTETIVYALIYVAVGVIWSFIKWFSFLIQFRDQYREQKEKFLTDNKLNPTGQIPEELREKFGQFLGRSRGYSARSFRGNALNEKPRASNNKSRIVSWMSLWPCSVVGTVLNDPIRRLFNFLFNHFKDLYQRLADHVFRNDVELK
jgi:hypothetical protein